MPRSQLRAAGQVVPVGWGRDRVAAGRVRVGGDPGETCTRKTTIEEEAWDEDDHERVEL